MTGKYREGAQKLLPDGHGGLRESRGAAPSFQAVSSDEGAFKVAQIVLFLTAWRLNNERVDSTPKRDTLRASVV
jgi:hypothetical protein